MTHKVCEEHAKNPARGYSPCPGCEIERLNSTIDGQDALIRTLEASLRERLAAGSFTIDPKLEADLKAFHARNDWKLHAAPQKV